LGDYEYKSFNSRLELLTDEYFESLNLGEENVLLLLELAQKGSNSFLQNKMVKSESSAFIIQLWDIIFLACTCILFASNRASANKEWEVEKSMLFKIKSIELVCLLDGFYPLIEEDKKKLFLDMALKCLNRQLDLAKSLSKPWMIFNSATYFWRLDCLLNGKVNHEKWTDSIVNLYETLNDPKIENRTMFVLISIVYANLLLDTTPQLVSKTAPKNPGKDNNGQSLKLAEEVLKQASNNKNCDIVTMLLIMPTWNKLQQVKALSGANGPGSMLEFEDPLLKQLSSFELTNLKVTAINAEIIETNLHGIRCLEEIPTLFKVRLYHKIGKLASELPFKELAVGIFLHILSILDEFNLENPANDSDDISSWRFLTQLDTFAYYMKLLRRNTAIYDVDSVDMLLDFYRKISKSVVLNAKITNNIHEIFWGYVSCFCNERNAEAAFLSIFKFIVITKGLFFGSTFFKASFEEYLKVYGSLTLNKISSTCISISKSIDKGSQTNELIGKIYSLLPYELRGPFYIDHPDLWDPLQEKAIKQKKGLTPEEKVKIAFAMKPCELKTNIIAKYHTMIKNGEVRPTKFLFTFYSTALLQNMNIDMSEAIISHLDSLTGNEYCDDSPLCLIFAILNDIGNIHVPERKIADEQLDNCRKRILCLINQLYLEAKRTGYSTESTEEKADKKKEKKGKKGNIEPKEEPATQDINMPENWESFSWPSVIRSQINAESEKCIGKNTIPNPQLLFDLILVIFEESVTRNQLLEALPILHLLELYSQEVLSNQPIYWFITLLLFSAIYDKNYIILSKSKYKKFILCSAESDWRINNFNFVQNTTDPESKLSILLVDLLIYHKEYEKAFSNLNFLVISCSGKAKEYSISKLAYISCISKQFQKTKLFTSLILKEKCKDLHTFIQSLECDVISTIRLASKPNNLVAELGKILNLMEYNEDLIIDTGLYFIEKWFNLKFIILYNLNSIYPCQYRHQIHQLIQNIEISSLKLKLLKQYFDLELDSPGILTLQCRLLFKNLFRHIEKLDDLDENMQCVIALIKTLIFLDDQYQEKEQIIQEPVEIVSKYLIETDLNTSDLEAINYFKATFIISKLKEIEHVEAYKTECALFSSIMEYYGIIEREENDFSLVFTGLSASLMEMIPKSRSRALRYATEILLLLSTTIDEKDRFK
jgi:hypothetical protein